MGTSAMRLRRLGFWFQVAARWFVAVAMMAYAATKVVGTQLTGEPSAYDTPMSAMNGLTLTWSYYGYDDRWRMIIAGAELTAALLLVFPRTARLGYLLCLSILSQIVPMDFIYGIGEGTTAAVTLFVLCAGLLAYDLPAVRSFVTAPWAADAPRVARRLGWVRLVALPLALAGVAAGFVTLARGYARPTELHGTWQFRDAAGPTRLYVDRGPQCYLYFPAAVPVAPMFVRCTVDESAGKLTVSTYEWARPDERFTFDGTYRLDAGTLTLTSATGRAFVLDRAPERLDEQRTPEFVERARSAR